MKRKNFLLLSIFAITSLASCGGGGEGKGVYTYHDYTMVSPSNWNELTYQDDNDTQIMSQIGSSFFSFDYKFDSDGKIIDNDFTVNYDAATKLEDVTKTYAGNEKWGIPAGSQSARAYKITLRQDLKWDDGTKIDASDFVYTMKEQLAPEFKNYRADSFYTGANVIHNAKNYFNNGQKALATPTEVITNDKLSSVDAFLTKFGNEKGYINWDYSFGAVLDKDGNAIGEAKDEIVDSGLTIKQLHDLWVSMAAAFGTTEEVMLSYFLDEASMYYDFPKMDYDGNVGLFVGDNNFELVLILDNPLQLLEEDGSLSYKAAYNMSSLPLVQKSKYEANKQAPQLGSTLWTSTYNSDVSSSASWGPYKLTSFQTGKQYILEKNENWYGYNTDLYKGQYMTTRIVCETIPEWKTAWQDFQKGNLTSIGIDPSVAADYKNSSQAVFTPDDFVQSLQLQSSEKALRENETSGVNKTILLQSDFRKAISLAIDRSEYAAKCTTSSKAGFGIFTPVHYYDVAHGKAYRDADAAKETLCEIYGVDPSKYDSLDAAQAAITGYDLKQARALVDSAYDKAQAAGDIKATDKVVLVVGTADDTSSSFLRIFDFLETALKNMVKETKLEGRLELQHKAYQSQWANDFRSGAYEICIGGWTGGAWDPGYFLLAYLSPNYMYSAAWNTSSQKMTYTMCGKEYTMSLMDWYYCLNGQGDEDWSEGAVAAEDRIGLIAALEAQILGAYYTVPIVYSYSATLISYQVEYASRTYNTFMAYGGIRYMTYNYDDAEWKSYTSKNTLDYKL